MKEGEPVRVLWYSFIIAWGVTRIESTTENYKKIGSPDTAPLFTGISRIIERQNS